jgi:Ca-activated chloride channel family protein
LNCFDSNDILSTEAVESFVDFQANVPFVAYTTLQMREAAESGALDAFIMENQTLYNDPSL